jgi:hypothetical protein
MIAHIMLWDELTKLWPVQVVTNATTHNPSVFFCIERTEQSHHLGYSKIHIKLGHGFHNYGRLMGRGSEKWLTHWLIG